MGPVGFNGQFWSVWKKRLFISVDFSTNDLKSLMTKWSIPKLSRVVLWLWVTYFPVRLVHFRWLSHQVKPFFLQTQTSGSQIWSERSETNLRGIYEVCLHTSMGHFTDMVWLGLGHRYVITTLISYVYIHQNPIAWCAVLIFMCVFTTRFCYTIDLEINLSSISCFVFNS